jgi:YVTN family beta-propeller protein
MIKQMKEKMSHSRRKAAGQPITLQRLVVQAVLLIAVLVAAVMPQRAMADTALPAINVGMTPSAIAVNAATNKIYVANSYSNNVTVIDGATNATSTVIAGTGPIAIAVNAATNKIYVANYNSDNVTVIDGATNMASTVSVGTNPFAIAVNAVTNKIYVANINSDNVTIIDGATNMASTVNAGNSPRAIAVNAATNKIYVANFNSANVTVIDGATDMASTVNAGTNPFAIAVNAATNKIYVANYGSANVTVIDGVTNMASTVNAGTGPRAIAVNAATNKIYVANYGSANLTVIDGVTNMASTVNAGTNPFAIAVNVATNKIYVTNYGSGNVTVIDGATNAPSPVSVGTNPFAIAVNPATNKIYVANYNSNTVTVIDGATNKVSTVSAGTSPRAIAVNAATNKIYVAYYGSNNVTVIDGATNMASTVSVGTNPQGIAVNAGTNKIYVANQTSNNVTVIDGATNATSTVSAGTGPMAIAVNTATNKIYVANYGSNNVTVIDGATNMASTVSVGTSPIAIAVNAGTNKIYVANFQSNNVTVIDGATNAASTVNAGILPRAMAVNAGTNKIYVANSNSNNVTVIDGATNAASTVSAGNYPIAIAVNAATNKIYVANNNSDNVTVIDGATNMASTVNAGTSPRAIAVNAATNKIYVANFDSANVTVIDGATNAASTVSTGSYPFAIAVNPVTNKIYVANSNNTVIDADMKAANPLSVWIVPFTGNTVPGTNTALSFYVSNQYSPTSLPVQTVYYQLDTLNNQWLKASSANGAWTGALANLSPGEHVLYAYASDGQDSSSNSSASPVIGGLAAYSFSVRSANVDLSALALNAGSLSPAFSPNVTAYTVELPADAANVDVTATTSDTVATMKVNGLTATSGMPRTVSLQPGNNTVTTAVYAQDGINEKTYTLTINRANANLSSLSVNTGTLSPAFAPNTIAYAVTAPGNVSQIGVTAVLSDPAATLTIDGQLVADSSVTQSVYLQQGGNQVQIVVTSANGLSQKTYILAVNGTIADANLSGLAVSAGTISPGFLSGVTAYSVDVGNAVTALDLLVTPSDNQALVIVNGSPASAGTPLMVNNLREGANTVSITVVARNSATKTYTLTVNRAATTAPTGNGGNTPTAPAVASEPGITVNPDGGITLHINPANIVKETRPDGTVLEKLILSEQAINKVLEQLQSAAKPMVIIEINDTERIVQAQFSAASIAAAAKSFPDAVFEVKLNGVSFKLQVSVLDLGDLAKRLGVTLKDLKVNIVMERVNDQVKNDIDQLGISRGFKVFGNVVDFKLTAEANGQTAEIRDFGGTYLARAIVVGGDAVNRNLMAVHYDPVTKTISFIPSVHAVRSDGKQEVVMMSPHNSMYTVIDAGGKTFADLSGHWAKADVELLASKLIVNGVADNSFAPDAEITRAEFAALLVRALGLSTDLSTNQSGFADVAADAWYAPVIQAALNTGLVSGIAQDRFAPNERITREQMAVMIAKAITVTGQQAEAAASQGKAAGDEDQRLAKFADRASLSTWAQTAVAQTADADIITGMGGGIFAPSEYATRAQAAVMLKRFLQYVRFID